MALKKKINAATWQKLPEVIQAEYTKQDDGEDYVLAVEGEEDTGALKRAKDHEAAKRKEAVDKAKKLEDELKAYRDKEEDSKDNDAKKKGDIDALENSWKDKNKKLKESKDAEISKLKGHLSNILVDKEAESLAKDISSHPKLLLPYLKQRLQADLDGDVPATRILDADGKPSALSLNELKDEFRANPDFSAVITASKASGGAKASLPLPATPGAGGPTKPTANLLSMSDEELSAHMTKIREEKQT